MQSNDSQASKRVDQSFIKKIEVNFDAGIQAKRGGKSNNDPVLDFMIQINAALVGQGIILEKVEILGADEAGRTVFFKNTGNKQSSYDFVPNDPRYLFPGTDVPYWIDGIELGTSSGMTAGETENAIVSTMDTWDAVSCSEGLGLVYLGTTSENDYGDIGLVQFFTGLGGSPLVVTGGIAHAGIVSPVFFDTALGAGAGTDVIGVTFTFSYGTDIDGNGKGDTAFSEIYINDNFNFQDAPNDVLFDAENIIDFETVVLHEVGHGLSQGHFGTAFRDSGTGGLHFSPAALMNAGYSVGRRDISVTDEAGHCSNWGVWPNN